MRKKFMSEGQDKDQLEDQEALKEFSIDEFRNQTIERYGLDEIDDAEKIDKIVNDRVEDRKRLSKAIGQKRDWRTKAESKEQNKDNKTEFNDEILDKKLDERLEKREIERLGLSDELKKEVQSYAKVNNVSVAEALNSSYIKFKKNEDDIKRRNDAAAAGGEGDSAYFDSDSGAEPSFDLKTEAGRKRKATWEKQIAKQLG